MGNYILSREKVILAPGYRGYLDDEGRGVVEVMNSGIKLDATAHTTRVKVFEWQIKKRFINRAINLSNKKYYGFISLMVAVSYVESIQKFREGSTAPRQSEAMFIRSIRRISGISEDEVLTIYRDLRCSLFHEGRAGRRIVLKKSKDGPSFFFGEGKISVRYRYFLREIKNDFNDYLSLLRDVENNRNIKSNFDNVFLLFDGEQ